MNTASSGTQPTRALPHAHRRAPSASVANYCPDNLSELQTTARNKLKSAQKRPAIIAACWVQANLW